MSINKNFRGTTAGQEIPPAEIVRDHRSIFAVFSDFLSSRSNLTMLLVSFAIGVLFFPELSEVLLIASLILTATYLLKKPSVPLKFPMQSGLLDTNDPLPETGAPQKAKGMLFLGNEIPTGREVWLSNSDCRQHFLILGTTGAGKTETLLGFAANALAWGSGFVFCDGKGDVSLYAKIFAMARWCGREDDLLVLNYMTGNRDLEEVGNKSRSNTINPFATGSSDALAQLVVSLMDETGGEGNMWKGRATAMLTGVIRALVWMRDNEDWDLNVGVVRDNLNFSRIVDLANPSKHPGMPQPIRKSVCSYLASLPGFDPDKGYKQAQTTLDQHGYLEMQFTKILGSLADVYGYIFNTPCGDVDMYDVVMNRRILVIMLPALEKSRDEVSNIGKIIVATLKSMMGTTLGSEIQGTWHDVVENRPISSDSPFVCIFDEVGYYMVNGMDLMAAQARSLGFSMVYAGQDINAMKSLNHKVFGSVQGNTNTKIIMRTEDPDTANIAQQGSSTAHRVQMMNFQKQPWSWAESNFHGESDSAKVETVNRIDVLDLKSQAEGDMHIIFKDKVVRCKSFYAQPEALLDLHNLQLRTNTFVKIGVPDIGKNIDQKAVSKVYSCLVSELAKLSERKSPDLKKRKSKDADGMFDRMAEIFDHFDTRKGMNLCQISCAAFQSVDEVFQSSAMHSGKESVEDSGDSSDEYIVDNPDEFLDMEESNAALDLWPQEDEIKDRTNRLSTGNIEALQNGG